MNTNHQNPLETPPISRKATTLCKADYLDIIFEGRNKGYGAYDLRRTYPERVKNAIFWAIFTVTALVVIPFIASTIYASNKPITFVDPHLTNWTPPPPKTAEKKVIPPPPKTETELPPPQVETKRFVQFVVTIDDKVTETPPKIEDLEGKAIGQETKEGAKGENAAPVAVNNGSKVTAAPPPIVMEEKPKIIPEEPQIFVEKRPEFPGGERALLQYLADNIRYPTMARESSIEGKVFIQFVVERNGSISGVKILRGIGSGCDEEAARVVMSLPHFSPGIQNGHPVRVLYNLPVMFQLEK